MAKMTFTAGEIEDLTLRLKAKMDSVQSFTALQVVMGWLDGLPELPAECLLDGDEPGFTGMAPDAHPDFSGLADDFGAAYRGFTSVYQEFAAAIEPEPPAWLKPQPVDPEAKKTSPADLAFRDDPDSPPEATQAVTGAVFHRSTPDVPVEPVEEAAPAPKIPYAGKDREAFEEGRKPWTPERDAALIGFWNDGLSRKELADKMEISVGALDQRTYRLQQQGRIAKRPPVPRAAPVTPDVMPSHPEKMTEAEMQAVVDALQPIDEGWRTSDDVAIVEAIVAGDGAGKIAQDLGVSKALVLGRLREIVAKASPHNYEMALKCLLRRGLREAS